jgi:hypothetical protein
VAFDDDASLSDLEQSDIEGLYLVEDGVVRYRYLLPAFWEGQALVEAIFRSARNFLTGGEPDLFALPLGAPGTLVSEILPLQGRGLLLVKLSGSVAQAQPGALRFQVEQNPDGSLRASSEAAHPDAERRFVLEALTPYLQRYRVQGVGLVLRDYEVIPELQQQFPDWMFVPLDSPEVRLQWLELKVAAVVDSEGYVRMPLLIAGGFQQRGLEELEALLNEAGR